MRRTRRLLEQEQRRTAQLLAQLREARADAREQKAAARRTAQYNTRLLEQLETSPVRADLDTESAHALRLENRLDRALRGAGRYLAELWAVRRELARTKRMLRLADQQRKELARQLAEVQDQNEAMCREAMGRAGYLSKSGGGA